MPDFIAEVERVVERRAMRTYRTTLVGEQRFWIRACQQAVDEERASWLDAYLRPSTIADLPWPLGADEPLHRYAQTNPPERDVWIAQAVAACAATALHAKQYSGNTATPPAPPTLAASLLQAAAAWQRAYHGIAPPDTPDQALIARMAAQRSESASCQQQLQAMLAPVAVHSPHWQRLAAVRDLVCWFVQGGAHPPPDHTATVLVPLDLREIGVIAELQLAAIRGGLGTCYPDPSLLAFFDDQHPQFQQALQAAWHYAQQQGLCDGTTDVRWSLSARPREAHKSRYLDKVIGNSIGAGFALALLHLLDPPRAPLDLAQSKWAITGALAAEEHPTGTLHSVTGYANKLSAALEEHLKVLVPTDDLADLSNTWGSRLHVLEGIATVEQASERISSYVEVTTLHVPAPQEPQKPRDTAGFVGRDAELADFVHTLYTTNLALITGMAGVGKTALAARLVKHLTRQHTPPPEKLFWHSFEQPEDASPPVTPPVVAERVFWHEFYRHDGVDGMIRKLAEFLAYQGHPQAWQYWHRTPDSASTNRPKEVFDYSINQIISEGGYLICLDDLWHVADDPLLDHIGKRLYNETQQGTLKLILTSRQMPSFISGVGVVEPLRGLSLDDTQTLLRNRHVSLPDTLVATLHERTGGNVQLLTLAIDLLRSARNPAQKMARLAAAADIERFLLTEVDSSLNDGERTLMHAVSVLFGQPASRSAIAAVRGTRKGIRLSLNSLIGHYLLVPSEGDLGEEYHQHDIVRDFYYTMLEEDQEDELVAMHERAGDYYETSEDEQDMLRAATHFERAGQHAHAASLVAGEQTWAIIRRGKAYPLEVFLNQITRRSLSPLLMVDIALAHGETNAFLQEVEHAAASYRKALDLLTHLPDDEVKRQRTLRLCYGMATLFEWHQPEAALDWVQQGLAQVTPGDSLEHAKLLLRKGSVLIGLNRLSDAVQALHTARHSFIMLETIEWQISTLINLAAAHHGQRAFEEAQSTLLDAQALCDETDDDVDRCAIQQNLGIIMQDSGEWVAAEQAQRTAFELAKSLGDRQTMAAAALSLGILATNRGEHGAAREHLLQSIELTRTFHLNEVYIEALLSFADLHIRLGAWDDAEAWLQKALQAIEEQNVPPSAEFYAGRAQVALAKGQLEQAQADAEAAVNQGEDGYSQRILGMVLHALQQDAQAHQAFQRSLALSATNPYEAARTRTEWAAVLLCSGQQSPQATALLHEAQATFAQLGAHHDLVRVEHLLQQGSPGG